MDFIRCSSWNEYDDVDYVCDKIKEFFGYDYDKSVYITGCFGFIGSYVTRACLKKGWYVRGIDKITYASNKDAIKMNL
jgi:hypothetical protein